MRERRRVSTLGSVGDYLEPLSRRERQVFRLLILGHTNSEIAQLLHLSVRTVESHRANLQRKLALFSRAQLVSFALRCGLLVEPRQRSPGA
jgi:DNA-binding CsgD family transcriptional regulator